MPDTRLLLDGAELEPLLAEAKSLGGKVVKVESVRRGMGPFASLRYEATVEVPGLDAADFGVAEGARAAGAGTVLRTAGAYAATRPSGAHAGAPAPSGIAALLAAAEGADGDGPIAGGAGRSVTDTALDGAAPDQDATVIALPLGSRTVAGPDVAAAVEERVTISRADGEAVEAREPLTSDELETMVAAARASFSNAGAAPAAPATSLEPAATPGATEAAAAASRTRTAGENRAAARAAAAQEGGPMPWEPVRLSAEDVPVRRRRRPAEQNTEAAPASVEDAPAARAGAPSAGRPFPSRVAARRAEREAAEGAVNPVSSENSVASAHYGPSAADPSEVTPEDATSPAPPALAAAEAEPHPTDSTRPQATPAASASEEPIVSVADFTESPSATGPEEPQHTTSEDADQRVEEREPHDEGEERERGGAEEHIGSTEPTEPTAASERGEAEPGASESRTSESTSSERAVSQAATTFTFGLPEAGAARPAGEQPSADAERDRVDNTGVEHSGGERDDNVVRTAAFGSETPAPAQGEASTTFRFGDAAPSVQFGPAGSPARAPRPAGAASTASAAASGARYGGRDGVRRRRGEIGDDWNGLRELGVPRRLLPGDRSADGETALVHLVRELPVPPTLVVAPGESIALLGRPTELALSLDWLRHHAVRAGIEVDVIALGEVEGLEGSVPRIEDADDAADLLASRAERAHAATLVVLVGATTSRRERRLAADALAEIAGVLPMSTWVGLDARRELGDNEDMLDTLPVSDPDVAFAWNIAQATRPGDLLGLDIPVALLDGHGASRALWVAALEDAARR